MMEFDVITNEKLNHAIDIISNNFGVKNVDVLRPPSRKRKYVDSHRALMYYLYKIGMSYTDIGRMLKVHHSTVIYHNKKFIDLSHYGINKDVKQDLDAILTGIVPTDEDLLDRIINCIFVTDFGMVNLDKTRLNLKKLLQ